ncbi:MAG: hypothetical protein V1847_04435 [Candidatus Diapherotrites archaeon]
MSLTQNLRLSASQKRVCAAIQNKGKSLEELEKELSIPMGQLQNMVRDLLKLELIDKSDGFPTRYVLKKEISQALAERKAIAEKDHFKLQLEVVIEIRAVEEDLLKKEMASIRESLEKDRDFTLYDVKTAEIVQVDDFASSYLTITLSVKDFRALTKLLFFYGPISLEVLKPDKWEIALDDLQDGLVQWSSMVHGYTEYIARMMSKADLEKFYHEMYKVD